jgi:purine-binding chemotaxis protein CheW
MNTTKKLCTFVLGNQHFAVDALTVQELIRHQPMTRVHMAPAGVVGLINLRGQIVTAIDLRGRLDMPPRDSSINPMNVVIRVDDGAVSLLVDQIGDVIEVDDCLFEEPPETLSAELREVIHGAYKMDGRLLLLLNWQEAVQLTESRV